MTTRRVPSLNTCSWHLPEKPAKRSMPRQEHPAVSVYLLTWKDTLAWAQRDPELLAQMKTGYPRFFIPLIVRELSERLLGWVASTIATDEKTEELMSLLAQPGRSAMLFPARQLASMCQAYLRLHTERPVVVVQIAFDGSICGPGNSPSATPTSGAGEICVAVYPQELAAEAKAFWQHTGHGISTRRASYWLENAPFLNGGTKGEMADLPLKESQDANITLQRRIGNLLSTETNKVGTEAVFLYPTGMSAISHTADAVRCLHGDKKEPLRVAVFGFLYVDTFKVLSKVHNFDCKLYGHATLSNLEADLSAGMKIDALYTEFPGNPLLGSVDFDRLYKLANDYDFMFIVDDTVATSVNVDLVSSCDVVCTSLTKMFSGACNVMGGSIALNPQSRLFTAMQRILDGISLDTYFPSDLIAMEKNSADFEDRVVVASRNAGRMADTLRHHPSVEQVYYPKGNSTQHIHDRYKRPGKGYGYLLSIRFKKPDAAIAFHDALDVAKGPSLGTNFTLCCAYALFAHYSELEWTAEFGVIEHLVRISVGAESQECLDELVGTALAAAESVADEGRTMNGKL